METGPAALVLFFGLFWGFGLGLVHPYALFDLPDLFNPKYRSFAFRRFLVGLILVDFIPILILWFLYVVVVPNTSGGLAVVSAALSALSIFGLIRILHALVASESMHHLFYEHQHHYRVAGEWIDRGSNSFVAHFIPGIGQLVGFVLLGYVSGRLA